MNLILLGPPGAGKGTQAVRIADRNRLAALSSGDILRGEMRAGSDVGQLAAPFVQSGGLVPDAIITAVMLAGLRRLPVGQGFILDGFPRTVSQAEALTAGLAAANIKIDAVLNFSLDDALVVRRIAGRRTCGSCQATYNVHFLPPKSPDVCDRCGSALSQRADDREDVVQNRLATYRQQTAPLVDYYRKSGLLKDIDAAAAPESVEREVARVLAGLGG